MRLETAIAMGAAFVLSACSDGKQGQNLATDTTRSDAGSDVMPPPDLTTAATIADASSQQPVAEIDSNPPTPDVVPDAAAPTTDAGSDAGLDSAPVLQQDAFGPDRVGYETASQPPDVGVAPDWGPDDAAMGTGKILFYLSPSDLETGVGPGGVSLLSSRPGEEGELLAQFATQISIIAWPEGTAVPSTASIYNPTFYDTTDPASYGKITVDFVTPPTMDRWYAVKVMLANRLDVGESPAGYKGPGSSVDVRIIRFKRTSSVRLNYVSEWFAQATLPSPPSSYLLDLQLSEEVDRASVAEHVRLDPPASSCVLVPFQSGDSGRRSSLTYRCPSPVMKGLTITTDAPVLVNGSSFRVPVDGPFVGGGDLPVIPLTYKFDSDVPNP
jgi:hypothetical protein